MRNFKFAFRIPANSVLSTHTSALFPRRNPNGCIRRALDGALAKSRQPGQRHQGHWPHFTADVLLEFGSAAYVVSFVNGTVARVAQNIGPETTYAFALRGPVESWSKFIQPLPPPMYNDIWAMAHPLHGRLKIEGDVKVMWQNLRAFTWTLDLMRNAKE